MRRGPKALKLEASVCPQISEYEHSAAVERWRAGVWKLEFDLFVRAKDVRELKETRRRPRRIDVPSERVQVGQNERPIGFDRSQRVPFFKTFRAAGAAVSDRQAALHPCSCREVSNSGRELDMESQMMQGEALNNRDFVLSSETTKSIFQKTNLEACQLQCDA